MTDKMEIKRTKVNLEVDKARLLKEKYSLVIKREELWVEIVTMNIVRSFNVLVRNQ